MQEPEQPSAVCSPHAVWIPVSVNMHARLCVYLCAWLCVLSCVDRESKRVVTSVGLCPESCTFFRGQVCDLVINSASPHDLIAIDC